MILLLNTSTPICFVAVANSNQVIAEHQWEAGRSLSTGLLAYIEDVLGRHDATWADIEGVVVYKGPGSFTGLRIGISVINALVNVRSIPVVGVTGDDWQGTGLARLMAGDSDAVVLPEYGAEANITTPRK